MKRIIRLVVREEGTSGHPSYIMLLATTERWIRIRFCLSVSRLKVLLD